MATLIGLALCPIVPVAAGPDHNYRGWKEWSERDKTELPPPFMFINVAGGRLYSSSGHEMSRRELAQELKALLPQPIPVFILDRRSIDDYPRLKRFMEKAGICRHVACLFKKDK
jgi:hypothetical protein